MRVRGAKGRPLALQVHCPCGSVQALGACRSHVSLCRPVGEGPNASLWAHRCVCRSVPGACLPGCCLCWPHAGPRVSSPPPTSSNFSTEPQLLVPAEAEPGTGGLRSPGIGVRGMMFPRVSVRSGGEGESSRRTELLLSVPKALAAQLHTPQPGPGSGPAVFVDLYACWETAGCQAAGPGVWASLAAPGLAQTPLPDGVWRGVAKASLAAPCEGK